MNLYKYLLNSLLMGLFSIAFQETGEFKVYEIKDPAQVNERCKEVGLGPIEEYLKRWNIEWKVED